MWCALPLRERPCNMINQWNSATRHGEMLFESAKRHTVTTKLLQMRDSHVKCSVHVVFEYLCVPDRQWNLPHTGRCIQYGILCSPSKHHGLPILGVDWHGLSPDSRSKRVCELIWHGTHVQTSLIYLRSVRLFPAQCARQVAVGKISCTKVCRQCRCCG